MDKLSNSILAVEVSEHGAELQSIRKAGREYLWQGDARFWGRRSPVLFPIVGRVWEDRYRHEGKVFEMGQHGFARDMDFRRLPCGERNVEASYLLESTPETLVRYPFPFRLQVGYRLEGNAVAVTWKVVNVGQADMYFQIGAHPAFWYPGFDASIPERGYFAFQGSRNLEYVVPVEKGCASLERHVLQLDEDGMMPIGIHTFDCDTYIFDRAQLRKVTLLDKERRPCVSLEFDTPLVGLWSPAKAHPDCPFVCIEPWYGRCDSVGYVGELKDREWMQALAPGEVFEGGYRIILE